MDRRVSSGFVLASLTLFAKVRLDFLGQLKPRIGRLGEVNAVFEDVHQEDDDSPLYSFVDVSQSAQVVFLEDAVHGLDSVIAVVQ